MGKKERILERLLSVPADFTFSELRRIMKAFGYKERSKGKTSGSRVSFFHPETKDVLNLHKPHPGDIMCKGAVRDVVDFLKERGHI